MVNTTGFGQGWCMDSATGNWFSVPDSKGNDRVIKSLFSMWDV